MGSVGIPGPRPGGQIGTREVTSDFGTFEKELREFARDGDDIKIGERTYRAIPPFEEDDRVKWTVGGNVPAAASAWA